MKHYSSLRLFSLLACLNALAKRHKCDEARTPRAGFAVSYGAPSYFSRDYKRVFGEPPRQHAARGHSEVW